MPLTDEVAGSVDDAIADNDAMFERHKPAGEAWNHYFLCGRSALRVIRLALAAAGKTDVRRVLDPTLKLRPQIHLLLATSAGRVATSDLVEWIGYENGRYFRKLLRDMHGERLIELSRDEGHALILPPGNAEIAELLRARTN